MITRVGCVILAAGESRRLGSAANKLLLPYCGKPLLQHAIDAASRSQAMTVTLVVGAEAELVLNAVDVRRCAVVANHDWKEGIASSIRGGLANHREDDVCIFMTADQPFIGVHDLNRLIAHHLVERDALIAIRVGDIWGTPMIVPQRDFASLAKRRGNAGAKPYAQSHLSRLRFVAALSQHAFVDVDTQADYERLDHIDPRT
ncbi:MAG: nucleotidyltransferase family protein [Candidatus Eremiobacteraeota bacterium]|nr:nucleotidyltransferase family protein [Candidatus Eremiobacteraeota bacterium]